jgi:hypothetical protein
VNGPTWEYRGHEAYLSLPEVVARARTAGLAGFVTAPLARGSLLDGLPGESRPADDQLRAVSIGGDGGAGRDTLTGTRAGEPGGGGVRAPGVRVFGRVFD